MSKVKIIKSKLSNSLNDGDLLNAFSGILNSGVNGEMSDLNIIYPKYIEMKTQTKIIICRIADFYDKILKGKQHFNEQTKMFIPFYNSLKNNYRDIFNLTELPSTQLIPDYSVLSKEENIKFSDGYKKIKDCDLIKTIVILCANIKKIHKYLFPEEYHNHDSDQPVPEININFILRIPTLTYTPFAPYCDLDFKSLYSSRNLSNDDKKECCDLLKFIYSNSYILYKVVISPDIDVDEFIYVMKIHINSVKTQIPRCEKAFSKIENSMGIFKDNFNDYYKEMVITKAPMNILISYISDVSKDTDVDATTSMQFKKIIAYFNKKTSSIKDPKANAIFDKIQEHMNILDVIMGKEQEGIELSIDDPIIQNLVNQHNSSSSSTMSSISSIFGQQDEINKIENIEIDDNIKIECNVEKNN